jgi:4-amino-4-deoxy-L-arabinose transferase-like glycosyltransferase
LLLKIFFYKYITALVNQYFCFVSSKYYYFLVLCIVALVAFLGFGLYIGDNPIVMWDESRQAMNAIEMLDHKNFAVTTFNNEVDLWNTKPSLLVFLQSLCFKYFGINEFSLRLPSLLAAIFTSIILFIFMYSRTKNYFWSAIPVFILLAMPGFNGYHAARTGDFDALLSFFMLAYALAFYLYLENRSIHYLVLFSLSLLLALFTKGVAALFFAPGLILYFFLKPNNSELLKNLRIYVATLLPILLLVAYYTYRKYHTSGYFIALWENELGGRLGQANYGHSGPWFYYFKNFWVLQRAWIWIFILPLLLLWYVFLAQKKSSEVYFLSFVGFTFLAFISIAQTKILWYDVPFYPVIALLLSFLLFHFYTYIRNNKLIYIMLVGLLFGGLYKTFMYDIKKELPNCQECIESNDFGRVVNAIINNGGPYKSYFWFSTFDYRPNMDFYVKKYQEHTSQKLEFKEPLFWPKRSQGFLLQQRILDSLATDYKVLESYNGIHKIQIQ